MAKFSYRLRFWQLAQRQGTNQTGRPIIEAALLLAPETLLDEQRTKSFALRGRHRRPADFQPCEESALTYYCPSHMHVSYPVRQRAIFCSIDFWYPASTVSVLR